jgi:pimeloyl-ACP methyl ester carboxylesterase
MDPFFYMPNLRLDDIQLHFEILPVPSTERDDLVVVFLHEALGSIPQWRNFPTSLCKSIGLNGIVYERQGHGESSPLSSPRDKNYLHHYALIELPRFIEEILSPEKKIILIGHSDGGSIALLYANAFPKRVAGIVTMAAHVINEPETIAGIGPAIEAFRLGKLDKLKNYHGDKTEDLFLAWSNTWTAEFFQYWNISEDIKGIQAPVFALQGQLDQYGTEKQLELLTAVLQNLCTTEMIPGLGHHPHLEAMEIVVERISNFIQGEILKKSGIK